MRRVFSSNDPSETLLVGDALRHAGIEVSVHNAFSGGSAVPEFRPPADLWIADDADEDRARAVVRAALAAIDRPDAGRAWFCPRCAEENPASFELCWNCGTLP